MRHPFLRTLAGTTTDPNFENVTLLLHGDGTNGGQNNTFVDGSTNNFTITRNGNTTQGTFSPYGDNWSNYFDGTDDYLSMADNANLRAGSGTFTIEAWIYRNATGAAHTIYAKGGASTGIVLQVTATNVLRFTHTTTNIDSTGTIALATWTHVAVVREGTGTNETKLYINGTQDGAGTVSTDFTQTEEVRIGTNRGATEDFNGYISNLRFVKGTAVYTGAFTVPTSPLIAISNTQLLTCKSNRFSDESANSFTVTKNNNASVQRFSPFSPTAAYAAGTIGGSGYFDGTGDYLGIPSTSALAFGTGDFCIEAWMYFNAAPASDLIISNITNSNTQLAFRIDASNFPKLQGWFNNYLISNTAVTIGQWHHIAVCRVSSTASLYLNGIRTATGTVTNNFSSTDAMTVGGQAVSGTENLNGYMSDLRAIKGSSPYDPTQTSITVPTAPLTAITNTSLLLNFTNAAIIDNAMMNDVETVGDAKIDTGTKKYGTGSIKFDGTGDSIVVVSNENIEFRGGNFTIEFWVNFTSAPSSPVLYNLWDPVNHASGFRRLIFYIYQNEMAIGWFGTTIAQSSGLTWTTGQWYHIAAVRNGSTWTIYRDGTSVATGTNSNELQVASAYRVGGSINGFIDDYRLTKGVARYTANFTAPTAAFPDL